MSGWEGDGVDFLMGNLLDPNSLCDRKTKHFLKRKFFSVKNMLFKGCEDDELSEISTLFSYNSAFENGGLCTFSPQSGISADPCPFSKYSFKDRYFFTYCVYKK